MINPDHYDFRYTIGYKAALRHVVEWFESHSKSIRMSKLRSYQGCMFLLKKLMEKADWLMQEGSDFEFKLTWEENKEGGGYGSFEEWKEKALNRGKRKKHREKAEVNKYGIPGNDDA